METLQSQRFKALSLFALAAASLLFVLYALLGIGAALNDEEVRSAVIDYAADLEERFAREIGKIENRAAYLLARFESGELEHGELRPREALIVEEEGDIARYYGEIYHFAWRNLRRGEWALLEMNRDVFFLKKLAAHLFYIRFFLNLDDNFLLSDPKYRFSSADLRFIRVKPGPDQGESGYRYDEARDTYSYSHTLKSANDWLRLNLRFSKEDIEGYWRQTKKRLLCLSLALLLLSLFLLFLYRKKRGPARLCWFLGLVPLFLFVSFLGRDNLYLRVWGIQLNSTYQVLLIVIFLVSLVYVLADRIKPRIVNYAAFNAALILALALSSRVLKGVDFIYSDFRFAFDYLSLVFLIFLLHLLPLFFSRELVPKKSARGAALIALGQVLAAAAGYWLLGPAAVNILIFSLVLFMVIYVKKRFLQRPAVLFLLALSIFLLLFFSTNREKREFVTDNLKNIFLNQKNYAKFIAREMVHEINSLNPSLAEFFQQSSTSQLVDIWRNSIARRENVASGIFLLTPQGDMRDQYSYQMPFIELPAQEFFPFWAVGDTTAELYGSEISLAIASASINKGREHLGYIIIQVLNSAKLILRHQEEVNIFTIDKKIDGRDFSYIKFNQAGQVVENPANINLENVAAILEHDNRWVRFRFTDLTFSGYIFKDNRDAVVIFFPENTFFKNFAEIIKIFLFLCCFVLLFYFKALRGVAWKAIYYSFSMRVFSFLILISLLTAVIFSLFSLNFNIQSSERKLRQIKYERGRTAQNIAHNLINESDEISPDQLVLISEMLNSDVSVYEHGVLLDSSNQRKSIDAEIPTYLHSQILRLLDEKNQKFVLSDDGYNLFFKAEDYIFAVEFPYSWRKILAGRSYHTDFIITLFFILAVIGFSAALFFRGKILSPINELNRGMAEVEKGNLEELKTIPSEIEIKSLYLGFNSMVEGIRREKQTISEISRMKTIIKLGRRVAHEVKNPLTPIKLSAEQILKSLKDRNSDYEKIIKKSVHFIMDEAEHLGKVAYGFLDLSRLDEIMAEEFDLMELVQEVIFNFNQIYGSVAFVIEGEARKYPVCLDKIKMKQALTNLLINSIEAVGEQRGEVRLNLEKRQDRLILAVADNGVGMDADEVEKIFDIDYSTKDSGTGLGLFIVKRIVELHSGKIEITSEKGSGTTVILDLPLRVKK